MHDAVADGADGGFGAVLDLEFREEGLEMRFDGVFRDEEGRGDFLVAAAFGEELQHFGFARGKIGALLALGEALSHFLGQRRFTGVNGADGRGEFVFGRVFEQIGFRARLHGAIDVFVRVKRGEHDDARVGKFFADGHGGFHAAETGQAQVHQHDVGFLLAIQFQRFAAIAGLADDFQAGLALDERGHAFAERGMIVHQHDPDGRDFFQLLHGDDTLLEFSRHSLKRVVLASTYKYCSLCSGGL